MERYSDKNLTLEEIANSLFVSKSYLSKLFHRDTGGHFHEYFRSVRLNQAFFAAVKDYYEGKI